LLRAARGGRAPVVAQLVAAGGPDGDTKSVSWRDRSAMHIASRCGSVDTVEVLLDAGVAAVASDRDMFGHTSLQLAAPAGHLRVVRLVNEQDGSMASQYNEYGDSPLHSAARNGHAEVAAFLIESTPVELRALNKDGVSQLASAGGVHDVVGRAVADALVRREKLRGVASLSRPLVHAVKLGRADVVSALLKGGGGGVSPSCDPDENLALIHAALVGVDPPSVVRALLAHTVCTGPYMLRNGTWSLAVLVAASAKPTLHEHCAEAIAVLVGAGADVNARLPHTSSALAAATKVGNLVAVTKLLVAGTRVNRRSGPQERTALSWAARDFRPLLCRVLLNAGAVITVKNVCGKTAPYSVQRRLRHPDARLSETEAKEEQLHGAMILRMLNWVARGRPIPIAV